MRRAEVRELIEQIGVRPGTVRRDPAPREERDDAVGRVVGEAASVGEACRLEPVVGEHIRKEAGRELTRLRLAIAQVPEEVDERRSSPSSRCARWSASR